MDATAASTSSRQSSRAGLNFSKSGAHNPNPLQHGGMGQAERAFSAASTFLSGIMAISASQFIGAPLKLIDPQFYESYMAWTKESFAVLMTTITQWWSPTIVRVSGDESMAGQLFQMDDGSLKCNFPHRLVLMANHQLYTDWLYLWWIAYTNKMHGRIYIIMKESLKNLPIFGWGAQFYNFIFLSRKWESDRFRLRRAFAHLQNPKDPMWLMIFPEGTNLSEATRAKSAAWAKKSNLTDMKHQLLPRTTGLHFCLSELKKSTNWLYDATIAYEGVPPGMYGQDIFTLRSSIFEGRPPKSVNIFWRRFRISDIPLDTEQAFSRWLMNRWREKDYILEYFYKFHHFPSCSAQEAVLAVQGKREQQHAKFISTEVKAGGWDEFLNIFGPITSTAGALSSIDLTDASSLDFEDLLKKVVQQQQANLLQSRKTPIAATSEEAIKRALISANTAKGKLPKNILNDLLQRPPTSQEEMRLRLSKMKELPALSTRNKISTGSTATTATARNAESSRPTEAIKSSMPAANIQSLITRPLTTYATQTALNVVSKKAAQNLKPPKAAKPLQQGSVPGGIKSKKLKPSSASASTPSHEMRLSGMSPARQSHSNAKAVTFRTPRSADSPKQQVGGLVKAGGSGSKPIGTQKYVSKLR